MTIAAYILLSVIVLASVDVVLTYVFRRIGTALSGAAGSRLARIIERYFALAAVSAGLIVPAAVPLFPDGVRIALFAASWAVAVADALVTARDLFRLR